MSFLITSIFILLYSFSHLIFYSLYKTHLLFLNLFKIKYNITSLFFTTLTTTITSL